MNAPHPPSASASWRLWQILDSGFPAGGFAHSGGLEAAWQAGRVPDAPALEGFALRRLADTAAGPLVFAREAHAADGAIDRLLELRAACTATETEAVAAAASLRLGGGLLSAARAFELPGLTAAEAKLTGGCPLPVAFGVVARACGVGAVEALRGALFAEARGVYSAAVRLGATGPLDAQRRLGRLAAESDRLVADSLTTGPEEVHATGPLLPLLSGEQPRLYSKLFQS